MMGVFRDDERSRARSAGADGHAEPRVLRNDSGHRRARSGSGAIIARSWRAAGRRVVIHHHRSHARGARRWRRRSARRSVRRYGRSGRSGGDRRSVCARATGCRRPDRGLVNSASVFELRHARRRSTRRCSRELHAIDHVGAGRAGLARWRGRTSSRTARWSICSTRRSPTSTPISSATPARQDRARRARRRCSPRRWRPRVRVNAVVARPDAAERRPERGGVPRRRERESAPPPGRSRRYRGRRRVSARRARAAPARTLFVDNGQRFLPARRAT